MLSYKQELTAAGLNERLASKTHDTTVNGRYTFSNEENAIDLSSGSLRVKGGGHVVKDFIVGQKLTTDDISILKNFVLSPFEDLTSEGPDISVNSEGKTLIVFNNSDLESVLNISGHHDGKILILVNATGNSIDLKHSTSLDLTKIISSTAEDIEFKNNSFIILLYSGSLSGWLVVNGGGSGGGIDVYSTIADRNSIASEKRFLGMFIHVLEYGLNYQLRGGVTNSDWYLVDDSILVADDAALSALTSDQYKVGMKAFVSSTEKSYIRNASAWEMIVTPSNIATLTNKDIDGGTASNTSRITVSKGLKSDLLALDRKQGTILFATDELVLYYDNGTSLIPLGAQLSTDTMISHTFKANGNYQTGTGIDGIFVLPWNAKISNVILSNEIVGSSGTTNIDIKIKPQGSGAFTSIFATTPKLASSAGSNAWVGIGDTVTGGTAAVLTDANRVFNSKDGFRMDILGVQGGSPAEMAITIYFEKV